VERLLAIQHAFKLFKLLACPPNVEFSAEKSFSTINLVSKQDADYMKNL
jgi:hypothetical protein